MGSKYKTLDIFIEFPYRENLLARGFRTDSILRNATERDGYFCEALLKNSCQNSLNPKAQHDALPVKKIILSEALYAECGGFGEHKLFPFTFTHA